MTTKQIEAKQTKELSKFETAKRIREILDATLKQWPEEDRNDIESEILDMVANEE